jgi:cohesin complex subunit SCC1
MADYGGSQDAPSERHPTPKSHGNEDRPPEGELTPVNLDAQSEPQLTPKTLGGAGAAPDEDMLPEFPRFSPADMPSPTREDDTPFKPRQTPHSGSGGLGAAEMPQSVTTYSSPGSTPHSDHTDSPFPVNDDFDGQPEIPGLISTPGGISSAGTGTTGLGSISARTR